MSPCSLRLFPEVTDCSRYYYQYQEHRLPICLITIHGLLHIPSDLRNAGPCWATWTFWTERFCGILQAGLHSRKTPAANLDKRVLYMAYLRQLENKYDLEDELSAIEGRRLDELKRGETLLPNCEHFFCYLFTNNDMLMATKTQIRFYGYHVSSHMNPILTCAEELRNIFVRYSENDRTPLQSTYRKPCPCGTRCVSAMEGTASGRLIGSRSTPRRLLRCAIIPTFG